MLYIISNFSPYTYTTLANMLHICSWSGSVILMVLIAVVITSIRNWVAFGD